MPTGDIRFTWTVLDIMEIKWSFIFLNEVMVKRGLICVLKSVVKDRYNLGRKGWKD
jgi:hypothetical protein